jgi:hypothetical protein
MPVLALWAEGPVNSGANLAENRAALLMRPISDDLSEATPEECGFFIAEEKPQQVAEILIEFFTKAADQ